MQIFRIELTRKCLDGRTSNGPNKRRTNGIAKEDEMGRQKNGIKILSFRRLSYKGQFEVLAYKAYRKKIKDDSLSLGGDWSFVLRIHSPMIHTNYVCIICTYASDARTRWGISD